MSHDAEHERLGARLTILAKALGLDWHPCPASDPEREDGGLDCDRGKVNFGRGPRDCGVCDGAGAVLRRADDPTPINPSNCAKPGCEEPRRRPWDPHCESHTDGCGL